MGWILLSLLAGFGDAISFAAIKKIKDLDSHSILALKFLISLPFLFIALPFYNWSTPGNVFYVIVAINAILIAISTYLMIKSIQSTPLSLSLPMLSFTPAFLLFSSYVMLRETPSKFGFAGVLLIVAGAYVIHLHHIRDGAFHPFKIMFHEKGIFYMLIVAFIFSFTANLAKIGITMTNPAQFMIISHTLISVFLILLFFKDIRKSSLKIKKNIKNLLLVGVSTAFMELMVAIAFLSAIVPYVISIKRSSIIFGVILGFLFFKEKNIVHSLIGTSIMLAGALLIVLL